jgi:nucleoid-associated protein YgaU
MKIKGQFTVIFAVICIMLLAVSLFGQEEEKLKLDDYKVQLAEWQTREADATTKIANLEAEINELNAQVAETQSQIDAEWDEIYALLGTDKAGYEAYKADLAAIDAELDGLTALSPEELFRQKEELEAIKMKIEEAKTNNLYHLTEIENEIAGLESKVTALEAKMPANIYDQYTVMNGDYLWKISGKEDIYGDSMQWIRIYCVNKDQIKDPDLIYPDQIFNIARGVAMNEYLVAKGDYLAKIAGMGKVFNDPTKWTKLYEANKDIVDDPNIIYPYQVLTIPGE